MFGRQTIATIDLAAIRHNFSQMAQLAPDSHTIAVIKADAYGHGAEQVAKALADDVDAFAVAFIDEALLLRQQGVEQPILLLEGAMSMEDMRLAKQHGFWVMLHQSAHFDWLAALPSVQQPKIWIKIDTGMHRLGIPVEQAASLLTANQTLLDADTVLCSHLACGDEPDNPLNQQQISRLRQLSEQFGLALSVANSAGIANWPDSHGLWNRLGIALYGFAQPANQALNLVPAMTLRAPIIALRTIEAGESVGYAQTWRANRTTRIATVAIGYADGYPRHAQPGTPALLHRQRVPLVGRVSMDMLTFDVSDVAEVQLGDTLELWGKNLSAEEVAGHASTISYELVTRMAMRVKRQFTE